MSNDGETMIKVWKYLWECEKIRAGREEEQLWRRFWAVTGADWEIW